MKASQCSWFNWVYCNDDYRMASLFFINLHLSNGWKQYEGAKQSWKPWLDMVQEEPSLKKYVDMKCQRVSIFHAGKILCCYMFWCYVFKYIQKFFSFIKKIVLFQIIECIVWVNYDSIMINIICLFQLTLIYFPFKRKLYFYLSYKELMILLLIILEPFSLVSL